MPYNGTTRQSLTPRDEARVASLQARARRLNARADAYTSFAAACDDAIERCRPGYQVLLPATVYAKQVSDVTRGVARSGDAGKGLARAGDMISSWLGESSSDFGVWASRQIEALSDARRRALRLAGQAAEAADRAVREASRIGGGN